MWNQGKKTYSSKFKRWGLVSLSVVAAVLTTSVALAAAGGGGGSTLSGIAGNLTKELGAFAKLITAGAYIAGLGFAMGAILKFKAHKDNPTQIPVGTPIALLFVAAALLFLPTLFGAAGSSLFGSSAKATSISGTTSLGGG